MASATYNPSRLTHDGLSRVIDSVDLFSVSEDQDLVVPGLSVRDVDLGVDGTSIFGGDPGFVDSGLLEITLFASNGTTSLGAGVSGCTFLVGDGVDDGIMSFRASLGGVKRALAGLTYRGKVDFYGTDALVVTVDDGGRFGRGALCEDSSSGDGVEVGGNHPPCSQVMSRLSAEFSFHADANAQCQPAGPNVCETFRVHSLQCHFRSRQARHGADRTCSPEGMRMFP